MPQYQLLLDLYAQQCSYLSSYPLLLIYHMVLIGKKWMPGAQISLLECMEQKDRYTLIEQSVW